MKQYLLANSSTLRPGIPTAVSFFLRLSLSNIPQASKVRKDTPGKSKNYIGSDIAFIANDSESNQILRFVNFRDATINFWFYIYFSFYDQI